MATVVNYRPEPTQPHSLYLFFSVNLIFLRLKKGKNNFVAFYGRFLSISKPTMAIAIIIAITPMAIVVIKVPVVAMST